MATVSTSVPFIVPIVPTTSWSKVSAGLSSTYGISTNNYLFAWGSSSTGGLGDGTTVTKSSPVQIAGSYTETSLAAYAAYAGLTSTMNSWSLITSGISTMAAIRSDGALFTWGVATQGELGNNLTASSVSLPTRIGTSSWTSVSAGVTHFAAIRSDGGLFVWGNNASGQLGTNDLLHRSSPIQIGTNSYISVSSGYSNTSAIDSTYAIWTWGNNAAGQLGTNDLISRSSPVQIGTNSWTQVSTGNSIVTATPSTGGLFAWGAAAAGQVGQGLVIARSSPVQITTFAGNETQINNYVTATGYAGTVYNSWIAIASAPTHTLAIRSDGMLFAWGDNTSGQLGLNSRLPQSAPVMVDTNSWAAVAAAAGATSTAPYSLAIRSDGSLYAWGNNTGGVLGLLDQVHRSSPVQVGTSLWSQISAGEANSGALRLDGILFTWGINTLGRLGTNDAINRSSPVQIGSRAYSQLSIGGSAGAALATNNLLWAWGSNANGQLGDNTIVTKSSPIQIGTSSWLMVAAGQTQTLAIRIDGGLFTWGPGNDGRLGNNAVTSRSSPVQVGTSSWTFVTAGDKNGYGTLSNGTLYAWGDNVVGELGVGDLINRSSPVQVGSSSWTSVSAGKNSGSTVSTAVALRSDGRLYAWGVNAVGQLGNYRFATQSSPVVVTTFGESFTKISSGSSHVAVVRADGALWTWGLNSSGQLGDNTVISRSAPVQIGSSSWSQVSAGGTHTIGLTSGRTLYGWGFNTNGAVGDATVANKSSPVQIGTSLYGEIETSINSSYAKKLNYMTYAWGSNNGQFGSIGTLGNRNSPTLASTIQDSWNLVSGSGGTVSDLIAYGIRSDGALFTWGSNANGQLGDSSIINKSNPVQLGTARTTGYNSVQLVTDKINVQYDSAFTMGTSNFTIEMWLYATSNDGYVGLVFRLGDSSSYTITEIRLLYGVIQFFIRDSFTTILQFDTGFNYLITDAWNHLALVRNGSSFVIYINGVNSGSGTSSYSMPSYAPDPLFIGAGYSGDYFTGYISNYRIVVGTAVYTADFTPPTSPLTAITNTVLLTCQSTGFLDNSNYGLAVNVINTPTISNNYPSSFAAPANTGYSSWSLVSAGGSFGGVTTSNNQLFTMGDDTNGQLGIEAGIVVGGTWLVARSSPTQVGTVTFSASPIQIGSSSWTQVSAGTSHVLATRTDGTLFAWGLNTSYQLGNSTNISRSSPVQVGTSSWNQISAGDVHSLGILPDSTLYGWGATGYVSNTIPYLMPYIPTVGNYYVAVKGAFDWMIALKNDGSIWAWGDNSAGALGINNTAYRSSPVQIGTSSWSQIGVANSTAYAIRADGGLFAWGLNNNGQIGDSTIANKSSPVQIGTDSWISLGGGGTAIKNDYTLWAWGNNGNGNLGINDTINRSSPVQVGSSSWIAVSSGAGDTSAFAIRQDGALFGWGYNGTGQLARPVATETFKSSPVQIGTSSWTTISTTGPSNYALRTDGSLFTWGSNAFGQLGLGDIINRSSPVQVGTSLYKFASLAAYGAGSTVSGFAIRNDGALFATGYNNSGQLGLSDQVHRSSPVQVGTSSWTQVNAGVSAVPGILSDGSLYTWGSGAFGQLGSNSTTQRFSPVIVGPTASIPSFFSQPVQISSSSWTQASAGFSHSLAIKSDSTLWGWGGPAVGPFSYTSWISGSIGGSANGIVRQDGALFMWGDGYGGGLGFNSTAVVNSPTQLGTRSYIFITVGGYDTKAIASDGTIWAWGGNVGDGTTVTRSSPVQVGTSSWNMVWAGQGTTMAIKKDNTLWFWGNGGNGINGNGTNVGGGLDNRSSPTLIGTSSWTTVAVQNVIATAIRIDGTLWAWGAGGQVGYGGNINPNVAYPYLITSLNTESDFLAYNSNKGVTLSSWSVISAGTSFGAAVRSDGALFTWGLASGGQLGDVTILPFTYRNFPWQIGTSSWTTVSAGGSFTLAIRADGGLFAWGNNSANTLGDGTAVSRSSPIQIGTSSWIAVTAGTNSSLAIRSDGGLFAWGNNASGQLGTNNLTSLNSPVQVGTSSWLAVNTGNTHTIGILSNRLLFAWGLNTSGQMGDGSAVTKSSPTLITSLNTPQDEISYANYFSQTPYSWSQISGNVSHIVAIRSDKLLFAWGLNSAGQLGDSTVVAKSSPIQIGSSSWSSVSTGLSHTVAVRNDGTLWAWGFNTNGALGTLDLVHRSSPVQVGTSSWTTVANPSFGNLLSAAIRIDGGLFAWGFNTGGGLGLTDQIHRSSPVQIGTSSWSQVTAGVSFTLAIRNDKGLFAWGSNTGGGALGDNTLLSKSSPVQIGTSSWSQVAAGTSYTLAIRSDGALFNWGLNTTGQLGSGDLVTRSSPIQIGTSSWSFVSAGHQTSYAIRSDGGVFAWGVGTGGQLGVSDIISRSSPVQIGTSSWATVSAGGSLTTMALTSAGLLYSWGTNTNATLGTIKQMAAVSSPVFIPTLIDSWTSVGTGGQGTHNAAIRVDGGLFAWGVNTNGPLGDGTTISKSNPVQIGTSSWTAVSTGLSFTLATRSGGSLFGWGLGTSGQLGGNDLISRSSPVQVGTGSWALVAAGSQSGFSYRPDNNILYGWGSNAGGQMAGVKAVPSNWSSPVVVRTTLDRFTDVKLGASPYLSSEIHALALRDDGRICGWAGNTWGELGDNSTQSKSDPTQIGNSSWTAIYAGTYSSMAQKADGSLWAWGYNGFGQLGQNDTVHRSNPVQIGNFSWRIQQYNGSGQGWGYFPIRYDGLIFYQGNGYSSPVQVGTPTSSLSNPVNYSNITQIGSSSWSQVSAGNNYSMAVRATDNVLFTWGYNTFTPMVTSPTNIGYSATQATAGQNHFGFFKKL